MKGNTEEGSRSVTVRRQGGDEQEVSVLEGKSTQHGTAVREMREEAVQLPQRKEESRKDGGEEKKKKSGQRKV